MVLLCGFNMCSERPTGEYIFLSDTLSVGETKHVCVHLSELTLDSISLPE